MRIDNFTQYGERANYHFQMRLTKNQKIRLIAMADACGFKTVTGYVRFIMFNPTFDLKLNRILEIVKELQETNSQLLETKQNEIIKTLTIITVLTAPTALIAAIFTIPAAGIPLVDTAYGFQIIMGITLLLSLLLLMFMKIKKWL